MGVNERGVQRAVKVASLSPAAKEAAREIGLDDNRTALLEAAKYLTPEAQVQALQQRKTGGIPARTGTDWNDVLNDRRVLAA